MLIRCYVELPLPLSRVEDVLLARSSAWLATLAGDAADHGEGLLAEVGIGPRGPRLGVPVMVRLGDPVRLAGITLVPMTWQPLRAGSLLPHLDADLELAPLGPMRTQLALSGRYRPPLGRVGEAVDRALLHRVAEATVKDFLDRTAAAVRTRAQASLSTTPSDAGMGP
jgi:hypothetical protein